MSVSQMTLNERNWQRKEMTSHDKLLCFFMKTYHNLLIYVRTSKKETVAYETRYISERDFTLLL